MFSERSEIKLQPNPLWKLLELKRKRGDAIIDLTESNSTRCAFNYPPSWIRSLSKKENLYYDPHPGGRLEARDQVVKYYLAMGTRVKSAQVFFTSGTSEAYHFLFALLFNRGERLLVPAPGYPLMESLGKLNDIGLDFYKLEFDGLRWKIDFDSLEGALRPESGAIMLVNPNNPTGSFVDRKDQSRLIFLAKSKRLPIIADEVFFDYRYPDQESCPRSFSTQNQVLTFTLNGLSKLVSLPQMKLSWILVTGPAGQMKEAVKRLEIISDAYLSVNTPVQNALGVYLKGCRGIQAQVMGRILENRAFLQKALKGKLPEGEILNSEGGWYATVRLPRTMTDEKWAMMLLRKEGVLVYPGHFFDFPMESCLILSLLPPEPLFREGIKKIIERVSYSLSIIG